MVLPRQDRCDRRVRSEHAEQQHIRFSGGRAHRRIHHKQRQDRSIVVHPTTWTQGHIEQPADSRRRRTRTNFPVQSPRALERPEESAPNLTGTLRRYLTQIAVSMRPGSVELIDTTLRHLAVYLTDHHPDVIHVADIGRTHVEGFETYLTSKPGYRGKREPAKSTTGMRLSHLRGFFDRIIEWGYVDAPARNPVFAGDMPIRDHPLPRFLCDADAAAFLASARNLPKLFDRVAVEVLSLTGLRKGEFFGLTRDAITEIGDAPLVADPYRQTAHRPLHPTPPEG